MALPLGQPGKIITFYSYKGGTGRSMAVANIACLLAKRLARTAQRVLVLDWDLEAPGLHRFFAAKSELPEYKAQPGVMNYFHKLRELLISFPAVYDDVKGPQGWRVLDQKLPLDEYLIPNVISGVDFMRAGRLDSEYPKLVGSFDWIEFFERYKAAILAFREVLATKFAYTLVDSRSGLTDVSGICTTLLPEKLVGVFTPNCQSLYGLVDLVEQAIEYRSKSDDFRPLSVFPLPSRVENAEKDLREQWRSDYQDQFERLFRRVHETERCDLTAYFDAVVLPHVSYYAYGENIAVLQERSDAISLSAAYQRFFERMIDPDFAWETHIDKEPEPIPSLSPVRRATKQYDAFLSYALEDVDFVSAVDSQLRTHGVSTFFVLRDLQPGENWAETISTAMSESEAIVVFVGPTGDGPWQDQESLAALENCARDTSRRIIPVLLPPTPSSNKGRLPNFLRNVRSVDFRTGPQDEDALENLIWALTGERPKLKKKVSQLRPASLLAAVVLTAVLVSGPLVSFLGNRTLSSGVYRAIDELRAIQIVPGQVASLPDLQKLEKLRQELQILSAYQREGVPLRLRWGLYVGNGIYPAAREAYFRRFNDLLFAETQKRVVDNLLALPESAPPNAPNDAYEKTYNELKAYLITTSFHDKSTKEFLTPVLMSHWVADRDIDKNRKDLAASQFDFYSTELVKENPFSSGNSPSIILHTQAYLNGFAGIDRYYVQLLGKASQNVRDITFNQEYPGSIDVIVSIHNVKGAFTRDGYQFVQDALKNPSLYLGEEEWVLGKSVAQGLDPAVVRQKLTERYDQDFVNEWNTVLKTSYVAAYSGFPDADQKLTKITGINSPLLLLFRFVSYNVDLAPADVKEPFAPVQAVEPPAPPDKPPDVLITPKMQGYVKALAALNAGIHSIAQSPGAPDPSLLAQVSRAQSSASSAVAALIAAIPVDNSQPFGNEKQIRRLLEEPITALDAPVKAGPLKAAGAVAGGFCSQMKGLYPFDPTSSKEMPVDQLYSLLAGDEWKKLNEAVKAFVMKVGSGYVANRTATSKPSPEFLRFLGKISALGEVMYPNGSAPAHFSYSLKQLPSNLEGVEVTIGSEKLSGAGAQKTFVWTGAAENIDVSKNGDTLDSASGPWAVFHFVARANHVTYNNLEWVIEKNGRPVKLSNGKIKSYDYQLQIAGPANPFFDLPGLRCVSQIAGK
jgi:cellulose biosynthesis protein BcsQ